MRIYFIISEDRFLKPDFLQAILQKRAKDTIGIAILPSRNPKVPFLIHLKRNLLLFGPVRLAYLVLCDRAYAFLDSVSGIFSLKKPYSAKSASQRFGITPLLVRDINSKSFLDLLKKKRPDVIVSSCSQIFGKELLSIPRKCCINRHTALLPKYGGVWPIFWAMLSGERTIGATIHKMTAKIDEGKIITQGIIPREEGESMFSLYRKGMHLSASLVLEALDIIEKKKPYRRITKKEAPSYFSYPKASDVSKFKKMGNKLL